MVQYFEVYDYDGYIWMLLELMDCTLGDIARTKGGDISEPIIAYVLREILIGLNNLHGNQILHRDIKSENILIRTDGSIKIGDFGFMAQLSSAQAHRQTKLGSVCWMAPELISCISYNSKVDIWAVGVIGIEMVEKVPPHCTETVMRALQHIVHSPAPTLKDYYNYSEEFNDFLAR
jgi:serine/threonine protein kinase